MIAIPYWLAVASVSCVFVSTVLAAVLWCARQERKSGE